MKIRNWMIGALLGASSFFSCEKPTLSDTGVIPDENLGFEFTDTLTVIAHTVADDSLRTDQVVLTLNPWGTMNDPIFGQTTAHLYTQFELIDFNIDLDPDTTGQIQFDSLVLSLQYAGSYGDTSDMTQTIRVYQLTGDMSTDSNYYADSEVSFDNTVLGEVVGFSPKVNDSITVITGTDTSEQAANLRIKLDDAFGQTFVDQSGTSTYADNVSFQTFFKGFYIEADGSQSSTSLINFDLGGPHTQLTLYYNDTSSVVFDADIFSASFSTFEHDYSGTDVETAIASTDPKGDSVLFVQGLSGTQLKVTVPHIRNLGNIAINKAELVLTEDGTDSEYAIPGSFTGVAIEEDGSTTILLDLLVSTTFFGGGLIEETVSGSDLNRYRINLGRYYQTVVDSTTDDFGILVLPSSRNRLPNRIVLGGSNRTNTAFKLKLNLAYTKLD